MLKHTRSLRLLGVLAALLMGSACATDLGTGPAPEATRFVAPLVDGTMATLDQVAETTAEAAGSAIQLLTCSSQTYAKSSRTIGSAGGSITVGAHKLVVPRGALRRNTTITAERVPGSVNSVRFSPEGLKFSKAATLTLSYANCTSVLAPKRVVYTDESLNILELIRSADTSDSKSVTGTIDHFSRYAVAY